MPVEKREEQKISLIFAIVLEVLNVESKSIATDCNELIDD